MDRQALDSYLEAQVLTATPQKLRLMLIDATISSARRVLKHWEDQQDEDALAALAHCRDLLCELLAGIKPDESELTRKVAALYVFLFKSVGEAQLRQDPKKVEETIQVLEVERDTWRMVCEQMPDAPQPAADVAETKEVTAWDPAIPLASDRLPTSDGLTLEA